MNKYSAVLPALALWGCAPSPAVQAAAADDLVDMVQESIGEYDAGSTAEGQPYLAVDLTERSIYPQFRTRGSFVQSQGCVVFRPLTGAPLTPIFPLGTRLVVGPNGAVEVLIGASRVSLGREYVVSGGPVLLASSGVALAAAVPASCPTAYYRVGSVNLP